MYILLRALKQKIRVHLHMSNSLLNGALINVP